MPETLVLDSHNKSSRKPQQQNHNNLPRLSQLNTSESYHGMNSSSKSHQVSSVSVDSDTISFIDSNPKNFYEEGQFDEDAEEELNWLLPGETLVHKGKVLLNAIFLSVFLFFCRKFALLQ